MKLIDVDNLKPTKGMFIYQTEDADVIATEAYRWELIEREAPIVKAIPVEYIKAFKEEVRDVTNGKAVIDWLLENWEKENDIN